MLERKIVTPRTLPRFPITSEMFALKITRLVPLVISLVTYALGYLVSQFFCNTRVIVDAI